MDRNEFRARSLMVSFDKGDRVIVTRDGVDTHATVAEKLYTLYSEWPLKLTGDNGDAFEITTADLAQNQVRVRLEPVYAEKKDRPMPGDAVRLAAPWPWAGNMVSVGDIAVIGGMVGKYPDDGHASITFNASTHRTETVVSCSGGPATIATDLSTLRPTGDRTQLTVWRFRGGWLARADSAKYYVVDVPVWEWSPGATD
ncbi:hypothetical protein [Amycolatopsis dendrobii]|uniref:Uncharacterized protein n=1 Tax=Amycolatopsis dendrobii TaxID=2760662 RepID=A0A7W3VUP2_9PSEU|nr:hypothetical protein [Amycolatopsis dendrobii]MBB1153490.1 hypothetical protein [Amycolatopsis dendrobii]